MSAGETPGRIVSERLDAGRVVRVVEAPCGCTHEFHEQRSTSSRPWFDRTRTTSCAAHRLVRNSEPTVHFTHLAGGRPLLGPASKVAP